MKLLVYVQPGASKTEIVGEVDIPDDQKHWGQSKALKIKIAAHPIEGAANEELIKFLAKHHGVSKSQVKLLSGENSRYKLVEILS